MTSRLSLAAVSCALLLATAALAAPGPILNMSELGTRNDYPVNSDIWGYRAPDGTELAIMGTLGGTSFINATNPAAPVEVAFIPGPSSIWRDIKTYSTYAYIVNETGDGLQIVDLSVPLAPTLVKNDSTYFSTGHNLWADTTNAVLYVPGADSGMPVLDLTDPENPTQITNYTTRYLHDIYVENGYGYGAAIYDGTLQVIDFSALPAQSERDNIVTPGVFTHNTWLSDDGNYCFTTDENSTGHIGVYDVSDPDNVIQVAEFTHPDDPTSIIHNVHINGDFAFISWYRTGIQVLDVSDPRFPQRVAYYDTFAGTGSGFDGAWGAYPLQPSGTIYVSDIDTGFHALDFTPVFGHVEGILTDSDTGFPIEDVQAVIATEGNTVFTESDGFYRYSLSPGPYSIAFSNFHYYSDNLNVVVADAAVSVGDFQLQPKPAGSLDGFVGVYGAYNPVADAELVLTGSPLTQATGVAGLYDFSSVPAGNYTLDIDVFGYAPQSIPVTITADEVTQVNITLLPAAYVDDLEVASGWTVGDVGDAAFTGIWELADPVGTGGGLVQPEDDHTTAPGVQCFVTGASGGSIGANDVDGGKTTLISPVVDLSGIINPTLRYYRWYVNNAGSNPGSDVFLAQISNDGGGSWVTLDSTTVSNASWLPQEFDVASHVLPTSQMRLKFVAEDLGGGSIVEAAVDDIEFYGDGSALDVPDRPGGGMTARLQAASPNPFQSATAVRFSVGTRAPVRLDVFDVRGRRVAVLADEMLEAGDHEITWDGRGDRGVELASGVYFMQLSHQGGTKRQKVIISR